MFYVSFSFLQFDMERFDCSYHIFNLNKPNGIFHLYHLAESIIFIFGASRVVLPASRIVPDGMTRFAASHLVLLFAYVPSKGHLAYMG